MIYDEKKDRNNSLFIEQLKKAYEINERFWKIKIPKFQVKVIYKRKEMDREWGEKTNKYFSAFAWQNRLVIFSRSVFEKVTPHKLNSYQDLLIHEINHLFYQYFVETYKPSWIFEGLALNLEEKFKVTKIKKINKRYLMYSYDPEFYWKHTQEFYEISYLAVKKLLKSLGKEKIFKLLK